MSEIGDGALEPGAILERYLRLRAASKLLGLSEFQSIETLVGNKREDRDNFKATLMRALRDEASSLADLSSGDF